MPKEGLPPSALVATVGGASNADTVEWALLNGRRLTLTAAAPHCRGRRHRWRLASHRPLCWSRQATAEGLLNGRRRTLTAAAAQWRHSRHDLTCAVVPVGCSSI